MANTIDATLSETTKHVMPPQREQALQRLWNRTALGAVLLLSIFMNFFQLGQNGYGNLYYAATVRSMGDNWQNFFFASFDPGGFVTVDKPPLGFWLQTLSTQIFGFSPFSIFFPQALCGVLAVLLLYALVRRHLGVTAGLLAALALAVTPISVVTNRNNTIDGTLALTLLLAAWAVIHAAETGKLRWLLLSSVFVGLGFNIKMAEAYLVVPALVMTYLLCAPRSIWTRIWHLALFTVVAFALSVSWLLAVDLTPTSQHPYIGSTKDNSALSLAFGYNGLNRFRIGQNGNGTRPVPTDNTKTNRNPSRTEQNSNSTNNTENTENNTSRVQQPQIGGQAGASGPFRLFSVSYGGQIAWLLPFALLAILALAWQRRFRFQTDHQHLALVLWGMWLLTMATFFTLDANFHQYYMTEMAPGLSALVGIGLVIMWKDYRSGEWRGWLLPLALIVTATAQIYMLTSYPAWSQWLSPLIATLTALAIIALIILHIRPQFQLRTSTARIAGIAISLGMLALLIAPTIWSGYSVLQNTESAFPTAGPPSRGGNIASILGFDGNGIMQGIGPTRTGGGQYIPSGLANRTAQTNTALISYLEANQGNTKFLLAVSNANTGAPIILATNKPVMAMGGFSGSDPILTTTDLQDLISNGTVRFFLLNAPRSTGQTTNQRPEQNREAPSDRGNIIPDGFGGQNTLSTWVSNHCSTVPASAWQSSTSNTRLGGNQLYDCARFHA